MNITVRRAEIKDIPWINEHYRALDFLPSDIFSEYVAVAQKDGLNIGLGRLMTLDNESTEMSGMYVAHDYRKLEVAKSLMLHLLEKAEAKKVYLICFKQTVDPSLTILGFEPTAINQNLPQKLLGKIKFCAEQYDGEIELLSAHRKQGSASES